MISESMLQGMMWQVLGQEYQKLPERVKQALGRLEVGLAREGNRLVVVARCVPGDEDAEKAGAILLDQMFQFLPEYLNKSFRVEVTKYR